MKRLFLGFLAFSLGCAFISAQTLDEAIGHAAAEMSERFAGGSTVAVINFQSDSARLGNYVIDELNGAMVRIGRIRAVERRQLDAIRGELHLNVSGEVSDESAQNIGRLLGAQAIIMGSIDSIGAAYRLRFQAISTEDAVIQYVFSENINEDRVLASLLGGAAPPVPLPVDTGGGGSSAMAVKLSAGLVIGITYSEQKEYYYRQNVEYMASESGFILNLINPTVNVRFLFPIGYKLELGFGLDLTYALLKWTSFEVFSFDMTGTAAPYAIIGYNNAYLHAGYDFAYGALYLSPSYKINEHLIIGLPMSLFGSNRLFGFASLMDPTKEKVTPPERYWDHKYFQIGLSLQYVF